MGVDLKKLEELLNRNDQCASPYGLPRDDRTGTAVGVAVQQWLEKEEKGGDPYSLPSQVMSQRVEMATQLLKYVTHDQESLDVDYDTPGIANVRAENHS